MSQQLSRATREAAIAAATARGCIVIEPNECELFIDIDDEASATHCIAGINRIKARIKDIDYRMSPSPSGSPGRFHIVVTVPGRVFTPIERVAWQAALGSDRMRELNSLCDILDGDPLPTIFFEKADGPVVVDLTPAPTWDATERRIA